MPGGRKHYLRIDHFTTLAWSRNLALGDRGSRQKRVLPLALLDNRFVRKSNVGYFDSIRHAPYRCLRRNAIDLAGCSRLGFAKRRHPFLSDCFVCVMHGDRSKQHTQIFLLLVLEPFFLGPIGLGSGHAHRAGGSAQCLAFRFALPYRDGVGSAVRRSENRAHLVDSLPWLLRTATQSSRLLRFNRLSCVGFPCTIGFVASELLVEAAVGISPWVGCVVVISTALNGIAFLRAYFRIFTGTVDQTTIPLHAMTSEKIAIFTLTILLVGVGLVPQPGVSSRFDAAVELLNHREGIPPPEPAQHASTLHSH